MTEEKYGEYIAKVKGLGKDLYFKLREKEIKHIRRCIRYYSNTYGRIYPDYESMKKDDLSSCVYKKFLKFGRLKTPISVAKKKKILKDFEKQCSHPGCEEKENLTIAHIKPLSSGVGMNERGNLKILCPKHHLLFDLKSILWRKDVEMKTLKKRIEDIEKKGTTDTLGMGVLNGNKFTNIDNDD